MRRLTILALSLTIPGPLHAQKHELGLTLGAILPQNRGGAPTSANLTSGTALQANYGYRLWRKDKVAVFGEAHFLANGQRRIDWENPAVTRDVAILYVTFAPTARHSIFRTALGAGNIT